MLPFTIQQFRVLEVEAEQFRSFLNLELTVKNSWKTGVTYMEKETLHADIDEAEWEGFRVSNGTKLLLELDEGSVEDAGGR